MDNSRNTRLVIILILLLLPIELAKTQLGINTSWPEDTTVGAHKSCLALTTSLQRLTKIVNDYVANGKNVIYFQDCHGIDECVTKSVIELTGLPPLHKVSKHFFEKKVQDARDLILSMIKNTNHDDVQALVDKVLTEISTLQCLSLVCSPPPKVLLKSQKQITVEVNDVITLRCVVISEVPAMVYWAHNNKTIDKEHKEILKIKVDLTSEGTYSCFATNDFGKGTTSGKTNLTVVSLPQFIEEPRNITYFVPMQIENKRRPELRYKAAGVPQVTVSWHFSPCQTPELNLKIREGTDITLPFDDPSLKNHGFYYCKVKNSVGEIKGMVAKFDVLQIEPVPIKGGCKEGYKLHSNMKDCNINECKSKVLNKCSQLCVNKEGYYVCSCKPGFQLIPDDRKTCKDVNECSSPFLNKCNQICDNTVGSYTCSCTSGYQLMSDKNKCEDIDECKMKPLNNCSQICHNIEGSFKCMCKPGFRLLPDGRTCQALGQLCDIVILLDVSKHFIPDSSYQGKIIKFIQDFVKTYKEDTTKRFGLVTFDHLAYPLLHLSDYNNVDQVVKLVNEIEPITPSKKSWVGLMSVRTEEVFIEKAKKIVLVLTDGYSENDKRFGDGFHAARREAHLLRKEGIHLISVSLSLKVDKPEMRAIAAYPKLANTVINKKVEYVLSTTRQVINEVVKGKCHEPLIDVGVLFKPRHYHSTSEYFADLRAILGMFQTLYKSLPDMKYYFASFRYPGDLYGFESYSLSLLEKIIKTYHRSQGYWFDIIQRAKKVLQIDFDEKVRQSLSKIKTFVLITVVPLEDEQIADLEVISKGEVDVVNVVLDEKITLEVANNKILSVKNIHLYIEILKEKRSKLICN